ncbi:hypothetical protein CPB86DRAFT_877733 [Serendipita vermifera]|nr:hypothetical protein CPB86DRAFT_877733 [Serendipita vermifera]
MWKGMSYRDLRWEPICGTLRTIPSDLVWGNDECTIAVNQFSNITDKTLAYFDTSGIQLANIGVGMGQQLCLCFAMSDTTGISVDICWLFNGIGQVIIDDGGWIRPIGSHRPGAAKSLPHCEDVNVAAVQSEWSATAVMPSFSGNVQTINLEPSTLVSTITSVQTQTLTPTLVNLTVSSSAVVTGDDGVVTTVDRSYTTTAAVINYEPTRDPSSNRIALGVGLGLGIPSFILALIGTVYVKKSYENKKKRLASGNAEEPNEREGSRYWKDDV